MLKERAFHDRNQWALALKQIAQEAGKDSPLYRILGTLAWGRYDGEPAAVDSKDNAVFGLGFLQGVRYAALNAASEFHLEGWRSLATIHDRIVGYRA